MWIPDSDPVESSSSAQQSHNNVECLRFHSSCYPDDNIVGYERAELFRRSGSSTFKTEVAIPSETSGLT
jgi:hypothetical protein